MGPSGCKGRDFGARFFLALVLATTLAASTAFAQYQVYSWESFEAGALSPQLSLIHQATPSSVSVVDYTKMAADQPVLAEAPTQSECGGYGLRLQTHDTQDKDQFVSVAHNLKMERSLLGSSGRALFQADFFLPEAGGYLPNSAVLAYAGGVPPSAKMYRFGIVKNRWVYFSYQDGIKEPPALFQQETVDALNLKRPGWHRFQIIFEGQDRIVCAVDGKPTKFSPVMEPTLTSLQPGFMISSAKGNMGSCLIDNLSIQWTMEDAPIPDSPWAEGAMPAAPPVAAPIAAPPGSSTTALSWSLAPVDAFSRAAAEKRPLLALFHAPRVKQCEALDANLNGDAEAQSLFSKFVLCKIDTNQLQGGSWAAKFQVYRVPTLMVFAPDGAKTAEIHFGKDDTWATVLANLRGAVK